MKKVKKTLKLIGFILIIVLGSIGLGFNGAVVPSLKRYEAIETTIELVETKEEESDNELNDIQEVI